MMPINMNSTEHLQRATRISNSMCAGLSLTSGRFGTIEIEFHQDISGSNYNMVLLENGTKIETFLQATSDVSRFMGPNPMDIDFIEDLGLYDWRYGGCALVFDRSCSSQTRCRRDQYCTFLILR